MTPVFDQSLFVFVLWFCRHALSVRLLSGTNTLVMCICVPLYAHSTPAHPPRHAWPMFMQITPRFVSRSTLISCSGSAPAHCNATLFRCKFEAVRCSAVCSPRQSTAVPNARSQAHTKPRAVIPVRTFLCFCYGPSMRIFETVTTRRKQKRRSERTRFVGLGL